MAPFCTRNRRREKEFSGACPPRDADAATTRLWRIDRTTGWRQIKAAMADSGIAGRHACLRGLRHGFGVGTLRAGVPLTLVHARLATTSALQTVARMKGDSRIAWTELLTEGKRDDRYASQTKADPQQGWKPAGR